MGKGTISGKNKGKRGKLKRRKGRILKSQEKSKRRPK